MTDLRVRPRRRGRSCIATHRAGGFSLVELMISLAVGLMVMAAIATTFSTTSRVRSEIERTSRQLENGRYAIELLSEDIRLAGYYGELDVGTVASPTALLDPCSTTVADWRASIPVHLQGYPSGIAVPTCVTGVRDGSDMVVVRRARTCAAGVAGCAAATTGAPYLQVSLCATEAPTTPYTLGLQGTAAFALTLRDCATAAPKRQYMVQIYFVSNDNGAGTSSPTLKRMELSGTGFTEVPLVDGIEMVRVSYGVDFTGDGVPDAYTTDPANFTAEACATCTPVSNWMNVVTAQIHVLARNTEVSPGYVDRKTYGMGRDDTGAELVVGPFNDAYRRHVYSNVVRIENPAGRRDTP